MQILKSFSKSITFLCFSISVFIIGISLPHYAQDDSSSANIPKPKEPETAEEYLKAGINFQDEGNYKEATPLFQQALGLYSQEENWNKIAETVYYAAKINSHDYSKKVFNGSIIEGALTQLKPLLPDTSYWMGKLYFANGSAYKYGKGVKRDQQKTLLLRQKSRAILE